MSFFFRPAFYPERPSYSAHRQFVSEDEAYYRRVAEEHQRRAQAALALAQEEERRRRQQRFAHDGPQFRPQEYGHPFQSHYSYGPFDFPFDHYESQPPRYEQLHEAPRRSASPAPRSQEQVARDDHERHIEEWLQRRRQREVEEAEFRRLKELERRRDDEVMREMLSAFGVDSLQRTRPTASPRVTRRSLDEELPNSNAPGQAPNQSAETCACGRHLQPRSAPAPEPRPSSSAPTPDFASQLWNALSGGRSDEERATILRELGLPVPVNVSLSRNAPAEQRPTHTQRTAPSTQATATPRPQTRPASIPIFVRSTTPSPSPTPAPRPHVSTPAPQSQRTPSPKPQSPFAHIESIQTKFDTLRGSFPDLANEKKKREYLAELNQLLTQLDQVESSGSESVRGARKALVRAVEEELERVEGAEEVSAAEELKLNDQATVDEVKVDEQQAITEAQAEETEQAPAAEKKEVPEQASAVEKEAEKETPAPASEPVHHVQEDVDIQSVSEADWAHIHPSKPTIEEPRSVEGSVRGDAQPEVVPTAGPQAAAVPDSRAEVETETTSAKDAEDTRGRQPTVATAPSKSTRARRPPSVEIEEVPDEESLSGSPRVGQTDL